MASPWMPIVCDQLLEALQSGAGLGLQEVFWDGRGSNLTAISFLLFGESVSHSCTGQNAALSSSILVVLVPPKNFHGDDAEMMQLLSAVTEQF